ncbi:MAG: methionine ABC transporter permease, partial [Epsilonproteobacteria bacterium]|nr:methionine ABC transporter permease [Campylobacterota bacterium]
MEQSILNFYEKSISMKQVLIDAVIETLTMSLVST